MERISSVHGPTWTKLIPIPVPWAGDVNEAGEKGDSPGAGSAAEAGEVSAEVEDTGAMNSRASLMEPRPADARRPATQNLDSEDSELQARLQFLTPDEIALFSQRVHARREAGEGEGGLGWRALVDTRIRLGHWNRGEGRGDATRTAVHGDPAGG